MIHHSWFDFSLLIFPSANLARPSQSLPFSNSTMRRRLVSSTLSKLPSIIGMVPSGIRANSSCCCRVQPPTRSANAAAASRRVTAILPRIFPLRFMMLSLKASRSVMEDDAQRVAMSGPNAAHAVPEIYPVDAARTLHRTVMDGEHHRVTLAKRHDCRPGLHAWTLFGHDEFSASEVAPRLGQQDRELQRKDVLAVEILVKTVVVAGAVLQDERRRPALACGVAAPDKRRVLVRKPHIESHGLVPAIGDRRELQVDGRAQSADDFR